ncbi:replicative DNA helicase [Porticoccaceae bacterium]|jgi:replicative DNA helicase|nr:replicative DNA helicase [Porticoccaceae bacterium]MDB9952461.1 replicative DNA helicase [Porticoccaceae bacterium]|tara:strand:- start:572 stop:2020 length:1449 start_codon:yes stop_codon:yes gene_type:complete
MNEALFAEPTVSQPLPHSIEAEQAVLGGLMLKNDAFDSIAEVLADSDFYSKDHQLIFNAMHSLSADGQPFDPITLSEFLQNNNDLSAVGGAEYLVDLAHSTPSSANIKAYTQIVLERSIVRQLIGAASDIVRKGYNPLGWDSSKLLAEAESRLQEIIENRPKKGGFKEVNTLIKEAVERLDELFKNDADITGLSTGFSDLDAMTSGWQKSDLIIIAGRPSMGKTAFAMNMVEHATLHQNRPVLVFSLEMPASSLVMRMLSSIGKIDATRMRSGNLVEDDWPRLSSAAQRLKDRPLFIDDSAGITTLEMRNRIKQFTRERVDQLRAQWHQEHGADTPADTEALYEQAQPGMIMVDYLQLMSGTNSTEGRVQEISQISRELKGLAREYECPMIALSQLSRNVEQRPNKRPVNADLRESGAIEQDADVIAFIYRDEVYNEDSPDKGTAEIILGKQRNGPIGTCRLMFMGKYTRFENLAGDHFSDN